MIMFQDTFGILKLMAQPEHHNLDEKTLESLCESEQFYPQPWVLGDHVLAVLEPLRL